MELEIKPEAGRIVIEPVDVQTEKKRNSPIITDIHTSRTENQEVAFGKIIAINKGTCDTDLKVNDIIVYRRMAGIQVDKNGTCLLLGIQHAEGVVVPRNDEQV